MVKDIMRIGGAGMMMGGMGIVAGKTGMSGLGDAVKTGSSMLSPMMTLTMTKHTTTPLKKIMKEMKRIK